jgi:DNA helicase-2/ATP-dependent DNA helicase PcrA
MQSILVGRYPILLIDESQDTNKHLIDALFAVQAIHSKKFALGLLGDMMQRIYNDGKDGLGRDLPEDWATPGKLMNHRCPRRVVTLINRIRQPADGQQQRPRSNAIEGVVRFFIVPSGSADKPSVERAASAHMARITDDQRWTDPQAVKTLTLEHRMAASRMGFLEIFVPLYEVESWRTSFLDGTLPATRFFTGDVLSLVQARRKDDRFTVARLVRALSPLLTQDVLRSAANPQDQLHRVNVALDKLMALWDGQRDPTLHEILQCIAQERLLVIPESLRANAYRDMGDESSSSPTEEVDDRQSERAEAIDKFLLAPFSQVEPLANYLAGSANFDTHQGVKGLEFERVMVIMDDAEARGFLFKYEDLFGGRAVGEKTVEATRRLFYVTCSRAERSLALIAYTDAPQRVKSFVQREGWFSEDEIVMDLLS